MTELKAQNESFRATIEGKTIIVDTSSLLNAGIGLLTTLPKCHFVIPAVVSDEIEANRQKAGVGFLAREWINFLDSLLVEFGEELSTGVYHPEFPDVLISIEPNHSSQKTLPEHLQNGSNDSTVLAVANNLIVDTKNKHNTKNVILMSNDTPMRLKATLDLKIKAIDFNASTIIGAKPFDGRYDVEVTAEDLNGKAFSDNVKDSLLSHLDKWILEQLPKDVSNHAIVRLTLKDTDKIAEFVLHNGVIGYAKRKNRVQNIVGRTIEQDIAYDYLLKPAEELPIVSLGGPAGTGKTLVALSAGIEGLRKRQYQKIIAFRSLHEMGQGQEMGFLPGGVDEKMEAWAGAVFDAIDALAQAAKVKKKSDDPHGTAVKTEVENLRGMVEVAPITYLRGRSLANTYIILEEAQNFSRSEILNILSRAGEGSKIVLTWDADQVDNKYIHPGKKADIWSVVETLKSEDLFAHISLKKTERSKVAELASRILAGG